MFENPILVPILVSVAYLMIWAIYRYFRRIEHNRIQREHRAERLWRTKFGLEKHSDNEIGVEKLRSAEWDSQSGNLMSAIEVKNREESRWPVNTALQTATGIFSGLFAAIFIWGGAGDKHGRNSTGSISPDGAFKYDSNLPATTIVPDYAFSYVVLTVGACLIGGAIVLWRSNSIRGKILGAALIAAAPLISGTKFVLIEKFSPNLKIEIPSKEKPDTDKEIVLEPAPPFSFVLTLPPFPEGSTRPDKDLRCVLDTLARDLAGDPDLSSITLVGRADKRELKPETRRKYTNNWGLAQQRGICVQQFLVRTGIAANKIFATAAGPVHTQGSVPLDMLARDRSVSLLVSGTGTKHPWSEGLSQGVEWRKCDERTIVADDLCSP